MAIELSDNLAARLGGSVGSGIANFAEQGLEALKNKKMNELLAQRELSKSLIGRLKPKELEEFLKNQGNLGNFLKGKLGGGNLVGAVSTPSEDFYSALQNQKPLSKEAEELFGKGVDIPSLESLLGYKPATQPKEQERESIFLETPQQERLALEKKKFALQEKKFEQTKKIAEAKEVKPIMTQINKEAKSAHESNLTLKKMEKLIDKGNLPPAALYKFLTDLEEKISPTAGATAGGTVGFLAGGPLGAGIGSGLGALVSPVAALVKSGLKFIYPDTEQFEKLSNSFIRGAKDIFGARITNLDLQTFLTTIPTLMQTDNGKRQIIKNMSIFNDASEVRKKALVDVLKKVKNGELEKPENSAELLALVDEEASTELDKLAKEFIS